MNNLRILAILLACVSILAHAEKVIHIADGDTLTVLHDNHALRIRLADIDAPEKAQAFGERSKQSLTDMCLGKDATYQVRDTDKYGRTLARVTCAGIDVNKAQVEKGMAWVYSDYNTDTKLPAIESNARINGTGLWADKNLFHPGHSATISRRIAPRPHQEVSHPLPTPSQQPSATLARVAGTTQYPSPVKSTTGANFLQSKDFPKPSTIPRAQLQCYRQTNSEKKVKVDSGKYVPM